MIGLADHHIIIVSADARIRLFLPSRRHAPRCGEQFRIVARHTAQRTRLRMVIGQQRPGFLIDGIREELLGV